MSSAMGWTALGRDSLLLPSALRELGYRTAIVGKLHLNPRTCLRHHTTGGPFGCGLTTNTDSSAACQTIGIIITRGVVMASGCVSKDT